MGMRHKFMFGTMCSVSDEPPAWFRDAYSEVIDFSGEFWVSKSEFKMFDYSLEALHTDVQKLFKDGYIYTSEIGITYYSDDLGADVPNIRYALISADSLKTFKMKIDHLMCEE